MKQSHKICAALIAVLAFVQANKLNAQTVKTPTKLQRHYRLGETIAYKMQGINQSPMRTIRYEAYVTGTVTKSAASNGFVEDLRWTSLDEDSKTFPLSPASQQFREALSLAPDHKLSIPDLSRVQPILIGPITDLLTFYADVQLVMRQSNLTHPGDHVYVKHGLPNSWADGTYTLIGQDSIDFDLTLLSVDPSTHIATVIVRHVPPSQPQIKMPAPWMLAPVGDAHNNWVQVQKISGNKPDGKDKYVAAIGQESFEADIQLDVPSGRIISAKLDNPVDVLERSCDDAALTLCATPRRYRIHRQITLTAKPRTAAANQ